MQIIISWLPSPLRSTIVGEEYAGPVTSTGKPDFKVVKNRQDIGQCLQETIYCNYNHKAILATAEELSGGASDNVDLAKKMFKYVRDNIAFGLDLYKVKASDTLEKGFVFISGSFAATAHYKHLYIE